MTRSSGFRGAASTCNSVVPVTRAGSGMAPTCGPAPGASITAAVTGPPGHRICCCCEVIKGRRSAASGFTVVTGSSAESRRHCGLDLALDADVRGVEERRPATARADPEPARGDTVPAEGAIGEGLASGTAVLDQRDRQAEANAGSGLTAVQPRAEAADLIRRHQLDTLLGQQARAAVHAAVAQHLREDQVIRAAAPQAGARGPEGGPRDDRVLKEWRGHRHGTGLPAPAEPHGGHAERLDDPGPQERVKIVPGDDLDHPRDHVERCLVAIGPRLARLEVAGKAAQARDVL